MEKFGTYKSPCIVQEVKLSLEGVLLAGSVVTNKTKIETAGQQVEFKDFSDSSFDSNWE